MSFSEDPTQGAIPGQDPTGTGGADTAVDPTLAGGIGEDPAQGAEVGETDYEDPTQGDELGSLSSEDPTR